MMGVGGWGLEAVLCLKLKAECMQLIAGHSLIVIYLNFSNIEPLNPETSYETSEEWIRFYFFDRIYRIDGIFFAFGEEPFRPKAVLSR